MAGQGGKGGGQAQQPFTINDAAATAWECNGNKLRSFCSVE